MGESITKTISSTIFVIHSYSQNAFTFSGSSHFFNDTLSYSNEGFNLLLLERGFKCELQHRKIGKCFAVDIKKKL